MIQLPDDARPVSYQRSKTNAFEFDQVWHSKEKDFTGTESDFLAAGHGYKYIQVDTFRRLQIK